MIVHQYQLYLTIESTVGTILIVDAEGGTRAVLDGGTVGGERVVGVDDQLRRFHAEKCLL